MTDRIYKALILNDYKDAPYADWVYRRQKTIETRYRRTAYRGDLVICCGKTNSVGSNAGKALCIVNLYDCRPMQPEDSEAARIMYQPNRWAWLLKDWRYFTMNFEFSGHKVRGTWQGLFDLHIPDLINIHDKQQPF